MRQFFIYCIVFLVFVNISKAQNHRDSVDVLHYDLHVSILNTQSSFISGKAILENRMLYSGDEFALDLYKLKVDSIIIEGANVSFSQNDRLIRVHVSYSASDTVIATIYYNGNPQKDQQWGGFFFQDGFAYNIGVGMGSYPHGIGRFWYPCIDSFTDRASYDYFIKTPLNKKGVGGGVMVDEWVEEDLSISHWCLNQEIPTYLSSIAVGSFIVIDSLYYGYDTIPLQLFSSKSDSSGLVKTFSQIHETTHAFEKHFGPYRWDRIGFVAIPFNRGAMEHATNIAFPRNALSGSLSDKTLAAHELSHHWFGNLVTCASSYEMWLNEGWASYSEVIFKEEVISKKSAQNQIVSNHNKVLRTVHQSDGGHYPLNKLPPNITYGKHAYDKGADIVHTLRHYLGDSLFFLGVNHYLNKFAYQHVTSQDLCDALTESTNENLQDFFDNWVYQAGFPHYAVDSFTSTMIDENSYKVILAMRQKLKARSEFSNSNRVELTFANSNWDFLSKQIEFNGENESIEIILPFDPKAVFIDLDKKCADATIDQYEIINKIGYSFFRDCDFSMTVKALSDSAFIQVVHNYALADNERILPNNIRVSNYYYWTINGLLPIEFEAVASFSYCFSSNTNPEDGFEPTKNDTIVLLYRENAAANWKIAEIGGSAKVLTGDFSNVSLQMGEYAIGFLEGSSINGFNQLNIEPNNRCYPVPALERCNIEFGSVFSGNIIVYNNLGSKITDQYFSEVNKVSLDTQQWLAGVYLIKVEGNQSDVHRVVKE